MISEGSTVLGIFQGISVYQDPAPGNRIHYISDLSVDVDGAEHSYRLDNMASKGALDDIKNSAGYPNSSWQNVLVRDPKNPNKPYVDENGFCVSMTSYQREGFGSLDRRRYLDADKIPYAVIPGRIRKLCRGVLLGCKARITDTVDDRAIDCVCGDFSGSNIGEASQAAARFFDPALSARNGDDRKRYLFEFFPSQQITIAGETFKLLPAAGNVA